ncbi:hypothetical protein V8D89_001255, partial [Ganoderma adspersum]
MAIFPRIPLPFDVVTNIMHFSSPTSVAAVMGTCRFLYCHGPKHLLRRGVILRTPHQITSFASFISAEGTARFRHLGELNLEVGRLECRALIVDECSVAVDALLRVLLSPSLSLHTLRLGKAEELLSSSHAIRTALRALATVKHLTVCDVGPATVSTVGKMSSKLVSVTICNIDPALDLAASSDQVLAMLAAFSDTLEEVSLVLDGHCNFAGTSVDICFPHVRSLTILSDSCCFLPSCVHAFPSVQVIRHNPSSRPQRSMICHANIHTFVECVDVAARQWSTGFRLGALAECSSDLLMLCVLRPALGAVRKLRISTQVHDLIALVLVADVLAAAQPAELEMSVAGLDTLEGVVALLAAHSLDTLRALRVDFAFGAQDHDGHGDASLAAALEHLAAIVDGFPEEVLGFDLVLDLGSCFGPGAVYLFDEEVRAFRACLVSSARVPASCRRRIIPVRPVCVEANEDTTGTDTDTDCGECEDEDARSDRPEWGYSDSEDEDKDWFLDEDEVEVEEDIHESFLDKN